MVISKINKENLKIDQYVYLHFDNITEYENESCSKWCREEYEKLSDSNGSRTHNHIVRKPNDEMIRLCYEYLPVRWI